MRHALDKQLFSEEYLSDENVVAELLSLLSTKAKTEFVLNCMNYANFASWLQTDLSEFIECMREMTENLHYENRIVLTYNPILTIILACEHLERIGAEISAFKHDGETITEGLLLLGEAIIGNMDQEKIRPVFLDEDYGDRTVLHIIVENGFECLMSDPKVIALLDELWGGTQSYNCDGKMQNWSMLTFIAGAPLKNLPG